MDKLTLTKSDLIKLNKNTKQVSVKTLACNCSCRDEHSIGYSDGAARHDLGPGSGF